MPRKRKAIIHMIEQAAAQRPPVLDLSNCNLGDLLDEVCRMTWLVDLNLSHCHINTLPPSIGDLTSLTRLSLAENQLVTLPDSIMQLSALRQLDLTRAGYEMSASEEVKKWLKTLPEATWTDGKPPGFEPPVPYYLPPDHPNTWLERLKAALKLYGDALAMEDRSFNGSEKRVEADARISEIFTQVPELQSILPEFYQDSMAHGFYSTTRDSEKTLDQNPFRLPTRADEDWLAALAKDPISPPPPLRLEGEIAGARRRILAIHPQTGQRSEVTSCAYGGVTLMNQPYAADENYRSDCAAQLFQAGSERFFLRVEAYGYGDVPGIEWFGSSDGGLSWQKQATLTYDWLNKTRSAWRALDHLPSAQPLGK